MENLFKSLTVAQYKKFEVDNVLYVEYKCLKPGSELIYQSADRYWSPRNYFVYVIQGMKKWSTQQAGYILQKDECLFIKKGAFASHKFYEKEDFEALIIAIDDSFIVNTIKEYRLIAPTINKDQIRDTIIPLTIDTSISAYFVSLLSYFSNSQRPSIELLKIKFKELVVRLVTQQSNQALSDYFFSLCRQGEISIADIMENNFLYDLSLDEFAKMSGRSLSGFQRDFKKVYQKSPGRWLTEKRLNYARWLLLNTALDVSSVAFDSGFKNVSHFVRVFKKAFNCTPGRYKSDHIYMEPPILTS